MCLNYHLHHTLKHSYYHFWIFDVFQATIFEPIIDFEVVLKYIPTVFDVNTHAGFSAGGYYKNKLPLGNEVTFFFEYIKGKI